MIDGCAAVRAEDGSAAHRGAAGGRRSTHLTVKSSTGRTGKSEENRRNTGQWLVSLLCLSGISFKFTWPPAYLSLEQREKRMERLRAKLPLSPLSLGTCVALEQVCSLSCRPPPRPFAAQHSKRATRVNVEVVKWKFAMHALGSSPKHSKTALLPLLADLQWAAVRSYSSDTPPNLGTPPTKSVIGKVTRRSPPNLASRGVLRAAIGRQKLPKPRRFLRRLRCTCHVEPSQNKCRNLQMQKVARHEDLERFWPQMLLISTRILLCVAGLMVKIFQYKPWICCCVAEFVTKYLSFSLNWSN